MLIKMHMLLKVDFIRSQRMAWGRRHAMVILFVEMLVGLVMPVHAATWCAVRFEAFDIKHVAYNVEPSHARVYKIDFLLRSPSAADTLIATSSNVISGIYRQSNMESGAYTYHYNEYYVETNTTLGKDENKVFSASLASVERANLIVGQMLFSPEDIDCGNAVMTGGRNADDVAEVPQGMTLTLRNTGGFNSMVHFKWLAGGTLKFYNCKMDGAEVHLDNWPVYNGTLIVEDCTIGFLWSDVANCQIRRSCMSSIQTIAAGTNGMGSGIVLEDSLIQGNADIDTFLGCQIKRNEFFSSSKTSIGPNLALGSSIDRNLFSGSTSLLAGKSWPAVQDNYFVAREALAIYYTYPFEITNRFYMPNNYWGGCGGPTGLGGDTRHWLDFLGGSSRNFDTNSGFMKAPNQIQQWPTTPFDNTKRPFPDIWLEGWAAGQGTLKLATKTGYSDVSATSSFVRQGRDILVCADVRAAALSLPGVVLRLRYRDGAGVLKELEPETPAPVLRREASVELEKLRSVKFIIPASDTYTNTLTVELWSDATGIGGYGTPGLSERLGTLEIRSLHRPPARALRIGVVPVPLPGAYHNPLNPENGAKVAARLKQDLWAMTPLKSQECQVELLPSYEGNFGYGLWLTTFGMVYDVSCALDDYRRVLNLLGTPYDMLVGVMPWGSVNGWTTGSKIDGLTFSRLTSVVLVDELRPKSTIHEVGHQLGLYTGKEQYDLPAGFTDPCDPANMISDGKGAKLSGMVAFNTGQNSSEGMMSYPDLPDRITPFFYDISDASSGAFDVMGDGNPEEIQWMVPSTYESFAQGLYKLLGETPPQGAGQQALGIKSAPVKCAADLSPGTRRILLQGRWGHGQYEAIGTNNNGIFHYELIPETLTWRDVTSLTTNTVPAEGAIIGTLYAWDSDGNPVFSAFCAFNHPAMGYRVWPDTNVPPVMAWSQTFDIPDSAASFGIWEYERDFWAAGLTRAFSVSNTLHGPVAGALSSQQTFTWQSQAVNSSPAFPVHHQLYFSTNGQASWQPLGNATSATNLTVNTSYLPATTNLLC